MFLKPTQLSDHTEIHRIEHYVVDLEQIKEVLQQKLVKKLVHNSNISPYKMEMENQHNVSVIVI